MPLTDIAIRTAKPTEKLQKLFDGNGLYLAISTTGNKSWRMKYRFQGKEKLLTFGPYPEISLKDAREACADARKMLRNGEDPSEAKKSAEASKNNTFEAIAKEWIEKQKEVWAPQYYKKIMQRLSANIFPHIGNRQISDISPPQLLEVLRKIENRGASYQANRVRETCSLIYRYAIATGRAERDAAADLRGAFKAHVSTPRPAITSPHEVGALMRAIYGYDGHFVTKCGLQILALTFLRPGEVRHGTWEEIDFEEKPWRIPAKRMKMRLDHVVPLSNQACDVLQDLLEVTGNGKYLFPSLRSPERVISDVTFLAALRRMGYEKSEMCAHGFRSMASTILNEQGYPADAIEKQLAHNPSNKIRGIYNRAEYLPERRKMMQEWADFLDSLRTNA